jgi:hypothetical protein
MPVPRGDRSPVRPMEAVRNTRTAQPSPTPTPTGTPGSYTQADDVWFAPADTTISVNTDVSLELYTCTGTQLLAAYGLDTT